MHAEHVGEGHGQHVPPRRLLRLVRLQLVLGREGETAEIVERAERARARRRRPGRLAPVEGAVAAGVRDLLAQAPFLRRRISAREARSSRGSR